MLDNLDCDPNPSPDTSLIIQPTSLAALTWAGAAAGSTAQSWRIGSELTARPLGVGPNGLQVLQVGALTVEADVVGMQLPLPDAFQVRVQTLGVQPQLQVLVPPGADPTLQQGLRDRLPLQNGYAPLLATLAALAQRPALRQLSPAVRMALAQLDQALRTPAEVTSGEGLRQAILRSGLFLESRLANPHDAPLPPIQEDWKGALLRIVSVLGGRPAVAPAATPGEVAPPLLQRGVQAQARALPPLLAEDVGPLLDRLQGDAKAALARTEVAQLQASTSPVPAWMIEIPLQGDGGSDVLQLQLEYARGDVDGGHGWNLGFALDLPALGPVQGELQLREPRLAVRLWAERADTVERLERQFTALRERLAACGVLLDQLSCQLGLPEPRGGYSAVLLRATA